MAYYEINYYRLDLDDTRFHPSFAKMIVDMHIELFGTPAKAVNVRFTQIGEIVRSHLNGGDFDGDRARVRLLDEFSDISSSRLRLHVISLPSRRASSPVKSSYMSVQIATIRRRSTMSCAGNSKRCGMSM